MMIVVCTTVPLVLIVLVAIMMTCVLCYYQKKKHHSKVIAGTKTGKVEEEEPVYATILPITNSSNECDLVMNNNAAYGRHRYIYI